MEQPEPHAPNAAAAKSDHAFAPLSDSAMPLIVWVTFESLRLSSLFSELCAKISRVCGRRGTPMTHVVASPPPQRSIRIRSASSSPKVRQCLCEKWSEWCCCVACVRNGYLRGACVPILQYLTVYMCGGVVSVRARQRRGEWGSR